MNNIIKIDHPMFWISKKNPRTFKYDVPDDIKNWEVHIVNVFFTEECPTPKRNEILFDYGKGRGFLVNLGDFRKRNNYRQPKNKFLRYLKYLWLKEERLIFQEQRIFELNLLVCEVCGRTSEEISICTSCFRCSDPKCNGGCIYCLDKHPKDHGDHCKCCGHEL